MTRFIVTEVTEIKTIYEVIAKNAPESIRKVRKQQFEDSLNQSIEQHFIASKKNEETIKEEK